MNIVIPMAGLGKRFVDAGFTVPKPLIGVDGVPMYARAAQSLPLELATQLIFVCLTDQLENGLRADINNRFRKFRPIIVTVNSVTRGQADTVLRARYIIAGETPLIIHNADTTFRSPLAQTLTTLPRNVAGVVTVFKETDTRWSFARLDDTGSIVEVAEKTPISNWATAGMYYFRRGSDFIRLADKTIESDSRTDGEFYVGPIYNLLIAEGQRILPDYANEVGCMGTPEDLQKYNEGFRYGRNPSRA